MQLAALMAGGWPSPAQLTAFAQSRNAACWSVELSMLGPRKTIQGTWDYVKERLGGAIPGASFKDQPVMSIPLTLEQQDQVVHRVKVGIPNMEIYASVSRNPGNAADPPFGHADFTCVIQRTGESVFECQRALYGAYRDIMGPTARPLNSPFSTPTTWHQRTFIMILAVPTYQDAVRNKKARDLFSHLIDVAASHGWAEYRTSPAFQNKLAAQYSFGDHALLAGGISALARHPQREHFATAAYAASKGAIEAMSIAAAAYYAPENIRINVIAPGLVHTPMTARAQANSEITKYIVHKQPLRKGMLAADDVAKTACFLLRPESSAITGQILNVDAGWTVSE